MFDSYSYCCRSPDLRPPPRPTLRKESAETVNYWHWAGVSPYTSSFDLAGTCVFVKQSLSVFCCKIDCSIQDISQRLRPAFVAEFLKDSSPDRLCILNSPTCVGLGTVKIVLLHESFLGNRKISSKSSFRAFSSS